jgi:PadR family transcriptional regulator, regulatory protein PadR
MTPQTLAVLNVLLDDPTEWIYGLELIGRLGFKGGTIYPLLARLERFGWLESKREAVDPAEVKRPRRKLYRLTGEGQRLGVAALTEARGLIGAPAPLGAFAASRVI